MGSRTLILSEVAVCTYHHRRLVQPAPATLLEKSETLYLSKNIRAKEGQRIITEDRCHSHRLHLRYLQS